MAVIERLVRRTARAGLLARKRLVRSVSAASAGRERVFVAGMQRSGTNMLMDVLERSLDTDVYHEWDPRAFDDYQMREPELIADLVRRSHAPRFVIKALCELPRLADLMERFAPAKSVWIVRHFEDVANSMVVSFKNQAKQVRRIAIDRNSSGWLGRGMSDDTHARVRELVDEDIDDVSAAALQWYFRNVLFFELGFPTDPRVLLVKYEALVSEPAVQARRIFEHLGLSYADRCARHISASSLRRRPAPRLRPEIRTACEDLWARFEASPA